MRPDAPVVRRPKMLRQYELIEKVRSYDPTADEAVLNRAYVYAMRMHGSQKRASGDPYFAHPIEVAGILTDYRLDTATIVTALLHDVIEDTPVTPEDIRALFGAGDHRAGRGRHQAHQARAQQRAPPAGREPAQVHPGHLQGRARPDGQAGRPPAQHADAPVHQEPAKRERIARETLDIYAPAGALHRLSPDLFGAGGTGLRAPEPGGARRHRPPSGGAAHRAGRGGLRGRPAKSPPGWRTAGLSARVFGREKHPYSIWRKLQRKSIGFSQLSDIYAFRVIVDSEADCYQALGVIHRAWPSVPERFKDYISTPKRNNYRSLHTTVVGAQGMRIEMQIRTETMDRIAEDGVAAHWRYKDKSYGFDAEAQAADGGRDPLVNLRHLVQVLEHGGDVEELVEHAKLEMYLDQVFVFTPKGKLVSLPRRRHAAGLRLRGPHRRGRHLHRREDQRRTQAPAHRASERRCGRGRSAAQACGAAGLALADRHRAARARPSAAISGRRKRKSSPGSAGPRWTRLSSGPASLARTWC